MQRQCEILDIPEEAALQVGMDFRLPQYRREVFLRFYEFHLRHKAHPGAVYFTFPWLWKAYNADMENRLWFCYINGLSQNVLTTWEIFKRFPNFYEVRSNPSALFKFFRDNYEKFGWDTDRRYAKNQFEKCVQCYVDLVGGGSQEEYFGQFTLRSPVTNFGMLWREIMERFHLFGRLSTFSYMEYLLLAGLKISCNTLFLEDITGSKSHRNGLCIVLGRDDMDWRDPAFWGYSPEQINWLREEAAALLNEAQVRHLSADYFTLESTLCCYKSWHRINRRYPNVYNDMFYLRIQRHERLWREPDNLFRQIRLECLPDNLLTENYSNDQPLKPEKQNHYLRTGEVIMMNRDWPCFKNKYNDRLKPIQYDDLFTDRSVRLG